MNAYFKQLITLMAVVLLVSTASAQDASAIVGKWQQTTDDGYVITVVVSEDMTYAFYLDEDETPDVEGKMEVKDGKMIIEDTVGSGCIGMKATFSYEMKEDELVVTTVEDKCPERAAGVYTYKRVEE